MLDVCLCTHNPRADILRLAVESLTRQTVGPNAFRVLVVDNASSPAVSGNILVPLQAAGIAARIVREMRLGIARARLRAIEETGEEWLLFVDDDNELSPDYIEEGLKFISARGEVGCFGGKLLLPTYYEHPAWTAAFLPYLGIKDAGDGAIIGKSLEWGNWEPPTAGAFIRRCLLKEYQTRSVSHSKVFRLGRKGSNGLASHEDALIMRGAFRLGLSNAYHPGLVLYHHLDRNRFKLIYLLRLLYNYGAGAIILESILKGPRTCPRQYKNPAAFGVLMLRAFAGRAVRGDVRFALGTVAKHLGVRSEHLRQSRKTKHGRK